MTANDPANGPRLLFVSHEASRTGAPIRLLSFLRWLRTQTELEFEVLLRRGGPLEPDFARIAATHVLDRRAPNSWSARLEREVGRAQPWSQALSLTRAARRRRLRHIRGFDLVYINSAASAPVIELIARPRRLLVSHIGELEVQFELSLREPGSREALFRATDRWIAPSDGVRSNLEGQGVPSQHISVQPGFIALPDVPDPAVVASARVELGVPEGTVLVGAMGTLQPRKGPDLFVALGQDLRSRYGERVHLVWIGAASASCRRWPIEEDIRRAGLGDVVHLAGELSDPTPLLAACDVFVLTSREEPFGLVCLEAAALGIPIVSFANGGMVDALSGRGGKVVPHLHVSAMADAVAALIDDPRLRAEQGRAAAETVRRHYDVTERGPALLRQLTTWLEADVS